MCIRDRADIDLSDKNLLRVGGLYQTYKIDDWWPPSGGGMWPGTFENINDGKRDRAGPVSYTHLDVYKRQAYRREAVKPALRSDETSA